MARMDLEKQLRTALKNDELRLHFQPIYKLKTGRMVACEALVRWQHPTRGVIMPGDFISQAEESGLIVPLGDWMMEASAKCAAQWKQAGYSLPVGINISPRQLLQQNLLERVKEILKQHKLPARLFDLELTETFLIKNMAVSAEILEQFKKFGCKISIDDFGTGYASLNYLKRLPVDYVKIDQSFIHGLADVQDAGLVKAIISMAHHLHLKVVAEGVETKAQDEFLKAANCDFVQGNFYSKPLPPDKFLRLIKKSDK
jgi:EAL domain-containing protein (putative c-di-GMP-specific phosphodiesterase class I)